MGLRQVYDFLRIILKDVETFQTLVLNVLTHGPKKERKIHKPTQKYLPPPPPKKIYIYHPKTTTTPPKKKKKKNIYLKTYPTTNPEAITFSHKTKMTNDPYLFLDNVRISKVETVKHL